MIEDDGPGRAGPRELPADRGSSWPENVAVAGTGVLPGMVWRPGDPDKHLSAVRPNGETRPRWSPLFKTRCGLGPSEGPWLGVGEMDDDVWCVPCLVAAGVEHRVEPR